MDFYVSDGDSDGAFAGAGSAKPAGGSAKHTGEPAAAHLRQLGSELAALDKQIAALQRKRRVVVKGIEDAQRHIDDVARAAHARQNERLKTGYESASFEWSAKTHDLLRNVFGLPSFRDNQEAIVNATLDGRDVVVIMPTGGGKSLCYQLPALVRPGLTLVVSPLIALMDDQVMHLKELGVSAEALTSESPNATEIKAMLRQMAGGPRKRRRADPDDTADEQTDGGLRLLYVSPEKIIAAKQLMALLEKIHASGKLSRIVIDECHCASEYGNDFRPDYSKLGMLKYQFPDVPVLALSATCPPRVLESVRKILGIEGSAQRPSALVYTSPLWRSNLRYSVVGKADSQVKQRAQVVEWIMHHHPQDRGIVYCATKNDAYEIAAALHDNAGKSFTVGLYYGNLERAKKEQLHQMWRDGRVQIIVATNAFGMGINSLDVRFVAHFTAPKTVENYYQESGRAGRDGQPADCVLFYRSLDSSRLAGWGFDGQAVDGLAKARAMIDYAECRHMCRKLLLQTHLRGAGGTQVKPLAEGVSASDGGSDDDDDVAACGSCDTCRKQPQVASVDCTEAAVTMVNIIHAAGEERMTLAKMLKYYRGNGLDAAPRIAALADCGLARFVPAMRPSDVGFLVSRLVATGVLVDTFGHSGYATNAYLDIADRYRHIVGRTVDQTQGLGPFAAEFTADALPGEGAARPANGD